MQGSKRPVAQPNPVYNYKYGSLFDGEGGERNRSDGLCVFTGLCSCKTPLFPWTFPAQGNGYYLFGNIIAATQHMLLIVLLFKEKGRSAGRVSYLKICVILLKTPILSIDCRSQKGCFYVLHSALFHLPPLRFNCVGRIWIQNYLQQLSLWWEGQMVGSSVADPNFFLPGSKIFPSWIRIKEFKYFNPKKMFLSTRKYDRVVHPGSGSWFFTHPGSRIQVSKRYGTRSRIQIRNIGREGFL